MFFYSGGSSYMEGLISSKEKGSLNMNSPAVWRSNCIEMQSFSLPQRSAAYSSTSNCNPSTLSGPAFSNAFMAACISSKYLWVTARPILVPKNSNASCISSVMILCGVGLSGMDRIGRHRRSCIYGTCQRAIHGFFRSHIPVEIAPFYLLRLMANGITHHIRGKRSIKASH